MMIASSAFVEAVQSWVDSMIADDCAGARIDAKFIQAKGELLAIHPEFRRCFEKRCPGWTTEQALDCLAHFAACAADCRGLALSRSR